MGYSLDSGSYSLDSKRGKALDLEVSLLLDKTVKRAPSTLECYSQLFVVPKALGGFRSVLDPSILNAYVCSHHQVPYDDYSDGTGGHLLQ